MDEMSAGEKLFNEQVSNSPVVKEIIKDLNGLREGQVKMENRMESVEQKVDNGFVSMGAKIDNLANVVTGNKEEELKKQLKDTKDALDRKQSNGDKIKNGSITGLIMLISGFILDKLGFLNVVG